MGRHRKRRIPKLRFSKAQGIGWHANFRDRSTGAARRIRFGLVDEGKAVELYNAWLGDHLRGVTRSSLKTREQPDAATKAAMAAKVQPGSLMAVASSYLFHEERRTRKPGEPRSPATICRELLQNKRYDVRQFLSFINQRHGPGAAATVSVIDLTMADVEAYNRKLSEEGLSQSAVKHRMQAVKEVIDRAGRPEHGEQQLTWNWDSRDIYRGKPGTPRRLPTLPQLKAILEHCDARSRAIVWMAIGLGFGQADLAAVKAGQIDKKGYDLRRGKTGLDRYGQTPPGVWAAISAYLKQTPRESEELLFVTQNGQPLAHGNTDAIHLWWRRLKETLGKNGHGLGGFYVLRHLGATEFGSRPGCSLGDMRRWLGHSASSAIADVYMRPVAPEHRAIVEWVRARLIGRAALS